MEGLHFSCEFFNYFFFRSLFDRSADFFDKPHLEEALEDFLGIFEKLVLLIFFDGGFFDRIFVVVGGSLLGFEGDGVG